MDFQNYEFFDNTLMVWIYAIGVFIISFIGLKIIQRIFSKRILKWARQTNNTLDDLVVVLLGRTHTWFILAMAFYFSSLLLTLTDKVVQAISTVTITAFFIQITLWGNGLITYWIASQLEHKTEDAEGATTMNVLGYVAKVVLWSVIMILVVDNIPGVKVDSLIASLGIGGVAVALALQNILGDLFASLSIALDKPFVIGDFVIVGDYKGTVERIGLNSTRIQSLYSEELVFPNSDLMKSRISNYKTMARRRMQFSIGVTYQTAYAEVKMIPAIIEEIITSQNNATFECTHFKKFGDYALIFEVVYYVEGSDYDHYMDIQQAINLAIFQRFEETDIEMAYPTQTLYFGNNLGSNAQEAGPVDGPQEKRTR